MHIANNGNNPFVGTADMVYLAWYIAGNPDYSLGDSENINAVRNVLQAEALSAENLTINIAEVDANPGDTNVRVPVTFKNNLGIGAAVLEFNIPEGLTLVTIENPGIEGLTFRHVSGTQREVIQFDPELMPEGYMGDVFATLILNVDELTEGLLDITLTSATTDARNNISDIRTNYLDFIVSPGGVNVLRPVVTVTSTHDDFNTQQIEVIGAKFNGQPGEEIVLRFDKPANNATIPSGYKSIDIAQVDIKLLGEDGREIARGGKMLDVPITITMQMPPSVTNPNHFRILHFSNDGIYEVITPAINNDGTFTFTITHFSIFAFVETDPSDNIKPGDINGDGNVNAADLSILLANFGKSGVAITNPAADLNDDGNVNAADLSILLANFGK